MDKKSKLKKRDIEVSFKDSYSAVDVTGSCVHLKIPLNGSGEYYNMLLDCGLAQGGSMRNIFNFNNRRFKFKVKELDYVIITHLHIDHSGLLPKLVSQGYNKNIIIPSGSKEILHKMLLNSAILIQSDAQTLTRESKNNRKYNPFYTKEDVENCMTLIKEVDFYDEQILNKYVRFKFISSQHIINSASVILNIDKCGINKKIYFSGDLGNTKFKAEYVNNIDLINRCDLAIVENTYNDSQTIVGKNQREKDIEKIKACIQEYAIERNGSILIPCFSLHRSQILLTLLYNLYKDEDFNIPIYVDGVLMNDICKIFSKDNKQFEEVMNWKNVKSITDKQYRMDIVKRNERKIILATSGFMKASALSWLQKLIQNRNNCLLFCGYFGGEGSLGDKLKRQKTIRLSGRTYKNNIAIKMLKSFSSHMTCDEMLKYFSNIKCEKLVLHHGNKKHSIEFKKELEKERENKMVGGKVIVADKTTVIRL